MKRLHALTAACALGLAAPAFAAGPVLETLLGELKSAGAGPFDAARGAALWTRDDIFPGEKHACADCHGSDLTRPGKHTRTQKEIKPLAPSVNPTRLSNRAEIDKWLLRNCKSTFNRECTAQEKGDLLTYIQSR